MATAKAKVAKVEPEEAVIEEVVVEEAEVEVVAEVEEAEVVEAEVKPYFEEPLEVNEAKRIIQRVKYAVALLEGTNPQLQWGSALSSVDRAEVQAEVAAQVAEENA